MAGMSAIVSDATSSAPQAPGPVKRPLGGAYWRVWTAATASGAGDGLVAVALPLAVAASTRSAAVTAGVFAVGRLPWLVCALPAGVLADRVDRGRLMVAVDLLRALVVGCVGTALLLGHPHWGVLYAGAFLLGSFETLFSAASHAAIPALVESEQLERANGWLFASELTGQELGGPAAGGVLFALMSSVPFLADAASFVVSAVVLRTVRRQLPAPARAADTNFRDDLREGLRFFRQSPLLRRLGVFVSCLASCQAIVMSVLVLFVLRALHLGPAGFGIIMAVGAVGNVVGSAVAPQLRDAFGSGPLVIVVGAVAAATYVGVATATSPVTVAAFILLECLCVGVGNVVTVSLRQSIVPNELRGRVGNAFKMIIYTLVPLAAVAGGWLAGTFGVRAPFAVAAVVQVVLVAALAPGLLRAIDAVDGGRVVRFRLRSAATPTSAAPAATPAISA